MPANTQIEIQSWVAVTVGTLLILMAGLGFLMLKDTAASDSIAFTALADLLLLAMSLAGLIVAAKGLGVISSTEALGLPSGSVRALLAFSLVIAFLAVVSWSLGDHGAKSGPMVSMTPPFADSELTDQLAKLQAVYPPPRFLSVATPTPTPHQFIARVYDQGNEQQLVDLQKQIVTILATALVAVVGFYFGGKSASDGASAAADTVKSIQLSLSGGGANPSAAPAPPPTLDDLKKVGAQVAALADAAAAQISDLGDKPADVLKEALASSTDASLLAKLADAQSAFDDLGKAAQAAATDKARAQDALGGLADAETDAGKLQPVKERLQQLLDDATTARQSAESAHQRFMAARDAITAATAAG